MTEEEEEEEEQEEEDENKRIRPWERAHGQNIELMVFWLNQSLLVHINCAIDKVHGFL